MGPKEFKDMMNYLTRPRMAEGGQINLSGGKSGLFEFYDAVGAGRGAQAREFFEKYGVKLTSSEFDVS